MGFSVKSKMVKRLTTEEFIEKAKKVHGDKYNYDKVNYTASQEKVTITCEKHGDFKQTPNNHLNMRGCSECSKKRVGKSRRSTTQEFITKAIEIHGGKYNYNLVDYKSAEENVIIVCKIHGDFEQLPGNHLSGKGCGFCGIERRGKSRRSNTTEFILKAKKVHGDIYDYSETIYTKSSEKVKIICKIHGIFEQECRTHIRGSGCVKCYEEVRGKSKTENFSNHFVEKAREIHGDKYTYYIENVIKSTDKIKINCKIHGDFEQTAHNHLFGRGCQKCGLESAKRNIQKSKEHYLKMFKAAHGDRYDYSITKDIKARQKIPIICKEHGVFTQKPYNHMLGKGCYECALKISQDNPTGWSHTNWKKAAERSKYFDSFKFYILKCWDDEEEFYKIGRTYLTIKNRFRSKKALPYSYEVLDIVESGNAIFICEIESKLKKEHKNFKYKPNNHFSGMYECFTEINWELLEKYK